MIFCRCNDKRPKLLFLNNEIIFIWELNCWFVATNNQYFRQTILNFYFTMLWNSIGPAELDLMFPKFLNTDSMPIKHILSTIWSSEISFRIYIFMKLKIYIKKITFDQNTLNMVYITSLSLCSLIHFSVALQRSLFELMHFML